MVGLLEPSKHMEAKDHLSLALVQEYFQQFELEKPAPTNAVFDQNSDKRTIKHLEMSHTTSPCKVGPQRKSSSPARLLLFTSCFKPLSHNRMPQQNFN